MISRGTAGIYIRIEAKKQGINGNYHKQERREHWDIRWDRTEKIWICQFVQDASNVMIDPWIGLHPQVWKSRFYGKNHQEDKVSAVNCRGLLYFFFSANSGNGGPRNLGRFFERPHPARQFFSR